MEILRKMAEWVRGFYQKSSVLKKSLLIGLVAFTIFGAFYYFSGKKPQQPQYETTPVVRDTLIVSVTASGQVSAVNNASISTAASGVVTKVFVKDGDSVKIGAPIAQIQLDRPGLQKYDQALASYQSAKNTVESGKARQFSLQATMFDNWDTFMKISQNSTYMNSDGTPNYVNRSLPEFHIAEKKWLAAEADYKNQQNVIVAAQTSLASALLNYQQASSTIYAPITGTVSGLSLMPGTIIASSGGSSTDATTSTSRSIANIVTQANPTIIVNLTEIDVPKVKVGNKVTITLDAFSGKTYTGKVISLDTIGANTSGVTSYPTVIELDTQNTDIFPNMSAQANIITEAKPNVLLVPASAVSTQSDGSTVQVLKNGKSLSTPVEIGSSSDTMIEITSGLSEGDIIITSTTTPSATSPGTGQTQSPFSSFGGGGIRGTGTNRNAR